MPRPNPFLRRASSPGDINHESNNNQQLLPVPPIPSHPGKLTQASLSDSALKVPVRPSTYRNTQSRMMSIRPSRFIKASTPTSSTSSPIILNDTSTTSSEMSSFIRLFDTYTQKMYIEGYLMKHNNDTNEDNTKKPRTKMFAELSGSTLTLWDTELPGTSIMPSYLQIVDTTVVYSNSIMMDGGKKKKHLFSIYNKKSSTIVFETSDDPTMVRWVSAIRLSSFEKQKLHQLFTLRLLSNGNLNHNLNLSSSSLSSTEETTKNNNVTSTFLQVRVPGTCIWQKYWVVIVDKKKDEQKNKRFGKKSSSSDMNEQHILLYETKKSKAPILTLSHLTHAYAVYPESPQLIEKGSMIRIDCKLKHGKSTEVSSTTSSSNLVNEDEGYCWLMADHSQLTIQWLLAVYDTFKLYGRPENLLNDTINQKALNFGEPIQDINTTVHPKLFLDTDEIIQSMDVSLISKLDIENIMNSVIMKKQVDIAVSITRRPTGTRANSLPLITVISAEDQQQKSNSDEIFISPADVTKLDLDDQPAPFKFARHVADSSDESDEEEEEEDLDEEDEEQDSDDEPICKKNTTNISSSNISLPITTSDILADSLIPDFDFGNGFDVPRNITAAAVAAAVNASNISKTLPTRGSRQQRPRHNSSITMFGQQDEDLSNISLHTRKASMPSTTKEKLRSTSIGNHSISLSTPTSNNQHYQNSNSNNMLSFNNSNHNNHNNNYSNSNNNNNSNNNYNNSSHHQSSSLFGDFSLATDFKIFLDEPLEQQQTQNNNNNHHHHKYSLSGSIKLNSNSFDNHRSPFPTESKSTTSTNNNGSQQWDNDWEEEVEPIEQVIEEEVVIPNKIRHPYDDDSYDSDFDGPLIPSLGDNFAPQNSLLDTYLGEQLSAKEQIEYAKATGQPLIQVSTKKQGAPRGGLVGMISQREKDRKEGNGLRVTERVNQHHAQIGQDRFEREKERRILEQRQHQFMKHQMMLYANGYSLPPMPMMHPHNFMPMSPIGPLSPMLPMSPMGPLSPMGPMSPMSPMGMAMFQQQHQQQHHHHHQQQQQQQQLQHHQQPLHQQQQQHQQPQTQPQLQQPQSQQQSPQQTQQSQPNSQHQNPQQNLQTNQPQLQQQNPPSQQPQQLQQPQPQQPQQNIQAQQVQQQNPQHPQQMLQQHPLHHPHFHPHFNQQHQQLFNHHQQQQLQQQMQQQFNQSSNSPTPPPLLSLPPQHLHSPMNSAPASPHTPNHGNSIRPIYGPPPPSSPMGYYQQGRQSPSFSAPILTHSNNRRFSRPLLDDVEESRTISPILRKSPVVSTSSGTSVRM